MSWSCLCRVLCTSPWKHEQDLVAFLPGELQQNKHKNPFYMKPTNATVAAVTNRRKRPRLSASRKLPS